MKTLKIRDKLLAGVVGQVLFIALLAVSFYFLYARLNDVSDKMVTTAHELNHLKAFAAASKDFVHDEIPLSNLIRDYKKSINISNQALQKVDTEQIWADFESIDRLKQANIDIEKKVMAFTEKSLSLSNGFIGTMVSRLVNPEEASKVTDLEKMVIGGANANNNNIYSVKILFLKMKENINNKEALQKFLEQSIAQTETDAKMMKGSPFENLPVKALELNRKFVELSNEFIENTTEIEKREQAVNSKIDMLFQSLNEGSIQTTKISFIEIEKSIMTVFIILGLISIALIFLSTSLRGILAPVFKVLPMHLSAISEGDLTIEPPPGFEKRRDEIGDLARSIIKMTANLKRMISDITSGAEQMSSSSLNISSASQQLSQGANTQASSVEEISSTMEQFAANIAQNTDNALQTEKISNEAQEGIQEVSNRSQKSVEAAKTIFEKIKIVNEIAAQTNLLALNAAIEAARAGESGKGFAVVAAEVRKLAERSKIAAEDITRISTESLELAEKTGKVMTDTLPKVESTTHLVQEIAAASNEQNSGTSQINSAIQDFSSITQQTASSSEELAASAEELASQAEQLKGLVSFFNVGQENGHRHPTIINHDLNTKNINGEEKTFNGQSKLLSSTAWPINGEESVVLDLN